MASARAARDTLCNPETQVSAHYLIAEDGEVVALVPEELRAWHAGAGAWGEVTDVNSRSIGIELANTGAAPFAARQIDALVDLLDAIRGRWPIPPERIIAHSDMAPGRKIDPGARFDWRRLAREGHGVWPTATEANGDFMHGAMQFGYTASDDPDVILGAFRLRFRPGATGPCDDTDLSLIADLARRFPVDASTPSA